MKESKNIWKITTVAIFFVLVFASVVQAIIKINSDVEKEVLFNKKDDTLNEGLKGSSSWEDHFNDGSKIDPSPPGAGASDNYIVESGEVKMINTYSIWTDSEWTRMKPVIISNNGLSLTNYAINFTVNYESEMQSDYDDIRFKHEDYPTIWLDYWIGEKDANSAKVWVEVPILQNGQSMMYLFYGNPFAASQSDFNSVFSWQGLWPNDEQISYHSILEGAWNPDVAYGDNRFLVTWEELISPPVTKVAIKGQLFDNNGVKIGNIFNIRTGNPPYRHQKSSVAFGNGKFFVAWVHWGWPTNPETQDIIGRLVTTGGSVSSDIQICLESSVQDDPNVAYDSVNNRFLVVWEDARNGIGNYNLYGKLFDTNGNQIGNEKNICVASNTQCEPWIAFDSINEQYMIV
ncbi:MAG: DUF2341 domain-containing protein, partial [Thermoplasmatales archaeon]